jgi:hypothetical protein
MMKYAMLLGIALATCLFLPATGVTQTADSIIIADVTFAPGQTQISVPVYFVTHGDVTYYNLPLFVESNGDIQFAGQQIAPALENWDDNWQGIKTDQRHAVQMGFSDLGGEDNPSLNSGGRRVEVFNLLFSIAENPTTQTAAISSEVDERSGGPEFGLSDGLTNSTPVVVGGNLTLGTTSVPENAPLPTDVSLEQNYPNPFNPTTEIAYALPDARNVDLTVYNLLGQNVRNLISGTQEAGFHKIIWDGKDGADHTVPSGIYFYKLEAGNFSQSMRMVFLK